MPFAPTGADERDRLDAASGELALASVLLNQRANAVFRAAATQIRALVEQRVEAFVLEQPAHTTGLGRDRVEKLKKALETSLAALPGASAKHLAGAFAWTFPQVPAEVGDRDRVPFFRGGGELPWMLDDVIRAMVAEAGRLAHAAGFEIAPASHWDVAPDRTVRRYLGPFVPNSQMTVALRSYADARLRYFRTLRSVRRVEAEARARRSEIEAEVERGSAGLSARSLWTTPGTKA